MCHDYPFNTLSYHDSCDAAGAEHKLNQAIPPRPLSVDWSLSDFVSLSNNVTAPRPNRPSPDALAGSHLMTNKPELGS